MKRMIGKHVLVGLSNRLCENAKTYENWGGQSFDRQSVHKTEDLSAYLPLHLLTSGGHRGKRRQSVKYKNVYIHDYGMKAGIIYRRLQ